MNDPQVLALREKFELSVNSELDALHPMRPAIVIVKTKEGGEFTARTDAAPGTPENPMSRDEVAEKALDLCAPVLGTDRAQRLVDSVYAIDNEASVDTLRPLLQN